MNSMYTDIALKLFDLISKKIAARLYVAEISTESHILFEICIYRVSQKKRNISILVIYSIQNDKEFVKNT